MVTEETILVAAERLKTQTRIPPVPLLTVWFQVNDAWDAEPVVPVWDSDLVPEKIAIYITAMLRGGITPPPLKRMLA